MEFDNLHFENILFATRGSLIELTHQLDDVLTIQDSVFRNITLGSIDIIGSINSEDRPTKVSFSD